MLTREILNQLQAQVQFQSTIESPAFLSNKPLWIKQDYHHQIGYNELSSKRYKYLKVGKIFSFQRVRYISFYKDHFFYYEEQQETKFKGYCCFQNVYFAFYPLKNKKYLFFLSNGNESSLFFFEDNQFYNAVKNSLEKISILLNFKQKYTVESALGKGSFSQVFLVRDKQSKRVYAAKIIPKVDKNNSQTKNIVQEERRILQTISSDYIYKFYQFYQENDSYVFILEYLPGKDLMTLFKQEFQFSLDQLNSIFKSILQGLADCHKHKVYHRDLKPQNIIIDLNTLKPKIIDFGLSLMVHPYTEAKSFKRCGTMGYMAPQVIANSGQIKKPYTQKCDIFSFGIIAYMILMGKNPLKGKSYQETYSKNKLCQLQLSEIEISEKYGQEGFLFLSRMLQKNPKHRYSALQAIKSSFLQSKIETSSIKSNETQMD